MDLAEVGDSGVRVSRVGLGCNNFGARVDLDGTRAVVEAALDAGVTFFDTADIYGGSGGSERMLGEILEGRRDQVVLATKFGKEMGDGATSRGAPEYVRRALDGSLERLRTDYVDLYYLHEPDPTTPDRGDARCSRRARAGRQGASDRLLQLLRRGARRGRSKRARRHGLTRFVAVQNYYNLLRRDDDEAVLPLCRELGIAYVPYFPLASGLLTGKYRRGEPAPEGTASPGGRSTTRRSSGSRRSSSSPTSADTPSSSSRSRHSPRCPAFRPSSRARRSRSRCGRTPRPRAGT